ncbi:hypothetical protein C8R46DRAFT_1233645 [Mycena filopes]|nr:hypothetical protein C8R46DRAFT_1233645 [Mycena filopes]
MYFPHFALDGKRNVDAMCASRYRRRRSARHYTGCWSASSSRGRSYTQQADAIYARGACSPSFKHGVYTDGAGALDEAPHISLFFWLDTARPYLSHRTLPASVDARASTAHMSPRGYWRRIPDGWMIQHTGPFFALIDACPICLVLGLHTLRWRGGSLADYGARPMIASISCCPAPRDARSPCFCCDCSRHTSYSARAGYIHPLHYTDGYPEDSPTPFLGLDPADPHLSSFVLSPSSPSIRGFGG